MKPLHYDVKVKLEPSTHEIHATVTITNPPEATIYLNPALRITGCSSQDIPVTYQPAQGDPLPYTVAKPVQLSGAIDDKLEITYNGNIDGIVNNINMIQHELVELALYAGWFPLFSQESQFEFMLTVDVPEGYLTTTNGACDSRSTDAGRTITQWRAFAPGNDIVLIASPLLQERTDMFQGMTIQALFSETPAADIMEKNQTFIEALQLLTDWYGPAQTRGLLRYVNSPREGWGYSRIPLFVTSEKVLLNLKNEDYTKERILHGAIHELTHFWWMIADTNTPEDWINEGLAEYSAYRVSSALFGDAFAEYLAKQYTAHAEQARISTAIIETDYTSPNRYVNLYEKTTLIYIEAAKRFGMDRMNQLFNALYKRFKGTRLATTDDYLALIARELGSEAHTYFQNTLSATEWIPPVER